MNPIKNMSTGTDIPIGIVHRLPGRARLFVPVMRGNRLIAGNITRKLNKLSGVHLIRANHHTGRLLVFFNEKQITLDSLMEAIRGIQALPGAPSQSCLEQTLPKARTRPTEPEDLPIKRQLLNVALGGGVLAYLGLKHFIAGRTPLAKHTQIFNLAAAAALISGYPVLRSGVQGLARGRINHDLVMSALSLSTILVRESIPGLIVIWLANLTALGQSLALKAYRGAIPPLPEHAGREPKRLTDPAIAGWDEVTREYTRKMTLPAFGLASLTGLAAGSGGFQKTLAMLLAANPSPAGLAVPTTATASMVRAGKRKILYRNSRILESLTEVDTVFICEIGIFPATSFQAGKIQQPDLCPGSIISGLRAQGLTIHLAGNGETGAPRQVSRESGIQTYEPGLTISGQVEHIRRLRRQGHKVAVVLGNTIEPSLLREADVSICLRDIPGGRPADILIPHPALLPDVFLIARRGKQRAMQNLALVRSANAAGLALGAAGWLRPMAASVYNNLVAVLVGANSLRLLSDNSCNSPDHRSLWAAYPETAAALAGAASQRTCLRPDKAIQSCNNWHNLSVSDALLKLDTDLTRGLDNDKVLRRFDLSGPNKIAGAKSPGFLTRFLAQFKDFLVKALIGSAVVCALIGELADALAILTILVLNAILGALQEQKAEGALQALNEIAAPTAKVRREGTVQTIPSAGLVPGDIVLLEQGGSVPADLRLLETHDLEIEESALTGEPYPVPKNTGALADCVPLLDCSNLAFMGTNVTRGRAVGLVTATGMATEIGKIAGMLKRQEKEPTPLQISMADIGNKILKYCLAASGLLVLAGILRGGHPAQMLLTGVCLAVAAIPEGLPAVVTIAMASGVRRMARENAVVRRLPAVETLGSATVICTDKTGTLTQNRQQVEMVYTGNCWWRAQPGAQQLHPEQPGEADPDDLVSLLTAGVLCNDATLRWSQSDPPGEGKPQWAVEGDPTEGAILMAALKEELNYREIRESWERVGEIPFDSDRLRMTVICRNKNRGHAAFVKGAPEVVIGLCSQMRVHGNNVLLDEPSRQALLDAGKRMSGYAMRVLAIAYRPLEDPCTSVPEQSLVFLGLAGMFDPPRAEVGKAIETCHRAGIKVVMITGDHPQTALAVAQKVGITHNSKVLTGQDLEGLNDFELAAAVSDVRVFARVPPAQKLRLVRAFRSRGEVLAMVGDGINDAPAVKEADIGVAMGQTGTDVTKQTADMVLTDDNFATLVSAVEQGRGIYSNIRRSVRYLLSTNVGLVSLVFLAVTLGLPMPLLPIQLLFLNMLGDGLPALALGVERPAGNLMNQPPRPAGQGLFAGGLSTLIINRGISIGITGLGVYARSLRRGNLFRARTMALSVFMTSKLLSALECSDGRRGKYNYYLIGSVALSSAMLAGAIYLPPGRRILKTVALSPGDLGIVFGASGLTCIIDRILSGLAKGATSGPSVSGGEKKLIKGCIY